MDSDWIQIKYGPLVCCIFGQIPRILCGNSITNPFAVAYILETPVCSISVFWSKRTGIKMACNSNSKKDKDKKKTYDIALHDVPLCLKLHVILIQRKTKKEMTLHCKICHCA